jgi:4-hydroxy-4-methyl-2-oxoglutarate aldolase
MIEEPKLLTVSRKIQRPDLADVQRFHGATTSFICDAMGGAGALDWRIKPVAMNALLGVALTCECGPADNMALKTAVAMSQPGDVLVVSVGGFDRTAVVGDLLLGIAKNRGVVGFVTDGLVRDLADIEALHIPVFAKGITPNSPRSNGPGSVGLPILCGGRRVESGDVVIADRDGVVTVPRNNIAQVLEALERVKRLEAAALDKVRSGAKNVEALTPLPPDDRINWID